MDDDNDPYQKFLVHNQTFPEIFGLKDNEEQPWKNEEQPWGAMTTLLGFLLVLVLSGSGNEYGRAGT